MLRKTILQHDSVWKSQEEPLPFGSQHRDKPQVEIPYLCSELLKVFSPNNSVCFGNINVLRLFAEGWLSLLAYHTAVATELKEWVEGGLCVDSALA